MMSVSAKPVFLLLTFLLVLTLCACNDTSQPAISKSVLTIALDDAPISIDPARSSTLYSEFIVVNAYDTLFRYKYLARPYELTVNLAASMPDISDDGLVYTIKVKQGVYFIDDPAFQQHKGRELTADDVVYSIKRHFDPASKSQGAWLWRGRISGLDAWKMAGSDYGEKVAGLKAIDRYTVRIELTNPYPQILHTLAMGFAAIIPVEAVEYYGDRLSVHPVGSGPYRVIEFNSTGAVLQRNLGYRGERVDLIKEGFGEHIPKAYGLNLIAGQRIPILDQIEIRFVSESQTRWTSFLKSNEIQLASIPSQMFSQVLEQASPNLILRPSFAASYQVLLTPASSFLHYDFNMLNPEVGYHSDPERNAKNKTLRCAITRAVNLQEQNEKFYAGLANVFTGVILPSMAEFAEKSDASHDSYEPQKSRQMLRESGWTIENLPVLDFGTTSSTQSRQTFELFKSWLLDIGYPEEKIRLKMFPSVGAFYKAISVSKLNFWFTGWTLDYPDAENILQLFYGPNEAPGTNSSNYHNENYDKLFEAAKLLLPSSERTRLYQKLDKLIRNDCVTISGISRSHLYAWHKDVVAFPDQDIVSGFTLRFYQIKPDD